MEINLMTWNTELYRYGARDLDGKICKRFEEAPIDKVIRVIEEFLNQNQNPIVVLQEIPFKRKNEKYKWEYNAHFEKLKRFIERSNCELFCLNDDKKYHIKMTVIIAKRGFLSELDDMEQNNIFVPVVINENEVSILGVHSHNAFELNEWIKNKNGYTPNIIIGDFNAGNYVKSNNDEEIMKNRANFQILSTGYVDACQGKYTTRYNEPTQIDHILIENSFNFNQRYRLNEVNVDRTITYSDHYPIKCKMTID